MPRLHAALFGTLIGLSCVLTACSSDVPPAGTSPSAATPSAIATPSVSAPVDPSADPLYLEAVDVYKKYFAEMQKFEAAGYPSKTLPASMTQFLTPAGVQDLSAAIAATLDENEAPAKGHSTELTAIAPNPGVARGASITSLRSCVDGTKVPAIDIKTGERVGHGVLVYREVFFVRGDGHPLLIDYADAKVVTQCPIK